MLEQIIEEIIQKRIVPESFRDYRELKGGTESTVAALSSASVPNLYVVKIHEPKRIAAEARFYELYHTLPLLPKVTYVDPESRYLIYHYIPGETRYPRGTKRALMHELVDQMIHYYVRPEPQANYEWVEDPVAVQQDIEYVHSVIGSHMTEKDHGRIRDIHTRRSERVAQESLYVLHGDFGVHNFLFDNATLSGVIDPIPVAGRPLYDLLYAFCSSPDELHLSTLLDAVKHMGMEDIHTTELVDDMILALYFRIGSCLIHHPIDLPEYLTAWNEWMLMAE